jgi:hypothetical protein
MRSTQTSAKEACENLRLLVMCRQEKNLRTLCVVFWWWRWFGTNASCDCNRCKAWIDRGRGGSFWNLLAPLLQKGVGQDSNQHRFPYRVPALCRALLSFCTEWEMASLYLCSYYHFHSVDRRATASQIASMVTDPDSITASIWISSGCGICCRGMVLTWGCAKNSPNAYVIGSLCYWQRFGFCALWFGLPLDSTMGLDLVNSTKKHLSFRCFGLVYELA